MTEAEIKVVEEVHHHSAPGALDVVRGYINTVDLETGEDGIATPDGLRDWLVAHALLDRRQKVGESDVARARELREDLRALAAANAGHALPDAAAKRLNRWGEAFRLTVRFDEGGESRLVSDGDGVARGLGAILALVHHAQVEGTWTRLKACAKDSCQWAFYDHSRNKSGAWCNMATCGNRVKVARFRQRQRRAAKN